MISQLLRNVHLIDPISAIGRNVDVLIVDGQIQTIDVQIQEFPTQAEVLDGTSMILGPGLVDLYSHSGEPGYEHRETLQTLLNAAVGGGYTRLALLPDTAPANDNPASLEWFRAQLQSQAIAQKSSIFLWAALTVGAEGQQMTELGEMAEAGFLGFADDKPINNRLLLRRMLEYVQPLGKPIALWCCDMELRGNGVVREGVEAVRLGLPGVVAAAETAPLSTLLELVETIGTPVHVMRISTARGVELIAQAKARGLPITASTTWMHLLLDVRAVQGYDPNLRLEPPLGNPADRVALARAVQDGVIDAIAVDHRPYTYEEKTVAFAEAPPGAIGLELALPLLWQRFVASGEWTAEVLWRSLSTNPARCLGQEPPRIEAGQTAELTLFDPHQVWTVTPQTLQSRSYNTPWLGKEVVGKVVRVWVR